MSFLNQLKTIVTPDFGVSDIWHQYLPYKFVLSRALKKGKIPFWTNQIANGLPILAQGQMGAFNLVNLFLFSLLPFPLAVNLFYLSCFSIALLGSYLLGLSLKFRKIIAFYFALGFAFSGFMISHLTHWDILQATSLLPLTFFFLNQALSKKNYQYFLGLSFILSQQIFTGASQIVFINLTGLFIFFLFKRDKKFPFLKTIAFFLFSIFLGFALSAVQLLPSWQYTQHSIRSRGLDFEEATRFPYPLKHILTFWQPFWFGSPKDGSYPVFSSNWGIFWENTAYIGKITLILSLLGLLIRTRDKKKQKLKKIALITLVFSFLLVLGKRSPFYFIFTFFPFNLFRVPSRFLLLILFALLVLSCLALEKLAQSTKKLKHISLALISLIILINSFDLGYHFLQYHPWQNFNRWLAPPQTAEFLLNQSTTEKIISLGTSVEWTKIFINQGWQDEEESFYYLRNGLDPNLNLLFNLNQLQEHNSIPLKRTQYLDSVLFAYLDFKEKEKVISLETPFLKMLSLNQVKYLISPFEVKADELKQVYQTESPDEKLPRFRIYQLDQTLPFAHFYFDYQAATTLNEFNQIINQPDFNPAQTVILEQKLDQPLSPADDPQIRVLKRESEEITLETETSQKGILVINDSYYPEWQATIDKQKVEIKPANLVQKAIIVPSGKHLIRFYYQGKYFKIGALISSFSLLVLILGIIKKRSIPLV